MMYFHLVCKPLYTSMSLLNDIERLVKAVTVLDAFEAVM